MDDDDGFSNFSTSSRSWRALLLREDESSCGERWREDTDPVGAGGALPAGCCPVVVRRDARLDAASPARSGSAQASHLWLGWRGDCLTTPIVRTRDGAGGETVSRYPMRWPAGRCRRGRGQRQLVDGRGAVAIWGAVELRRCEAPLRTGASGRTMVAGAAAGRSAQHVLRSLEQRRWSRSQQNQRSWWGAYKQEWSVGESPDDAMLTPAAAARERMASWHRRAA